MPAGKKKVRSASKAKKLRAPNQARVSSSHKGRHGRMVKSALVALVLIVAMAVLLKVISTNYPGLAGDLARAVEGYGLFGTFVAIFLGSSLLPFPTDAFFVTIISLAPNPLPVLAVAILAAFLSGLVNYALALALSERWVEKQLGKEVLAEAKEWMDSWGGWAIVLFGTLPLSAIFDPMTFVAGVGKMDLRKFAFFLAVARILHFSLLAFFALQAKVI